MDTTNTTDTTDTTMNNDLDFDKMGGLIPAIIQDAVSGKVLMLGFMNREAYEKTMETRLVTFYSRSRQCLWTKGETSGNFIFVSRILSDCDDDTLIYVGTPKGPVCHTGHRTCFFTTLWEKPEEK